MSSCKHVSVKHSRLLFIAGLLNLLCVFHNSDAVIRSFVIMTTIRGDHHHTAVWHIDQTSAQTHEHDPKIRH